MPEKKKQKKSTSLRQRAEKLVHQPDIDTSSLSRQEVERLAHELAVHQIELEIQNEDLRHTQQELMTTRDRYAELYNFAPVGYVTLDKNNLIAEANQTIAKMLDVDRDSLLGRRLSNYIRPSSQEYFYFYFMNMRQNSERNPATREIEMEKTGGSTFVARLEGMLFEDDLRLAIVDVSDLKRTEAALAKARDELEEKVKERTRKLAEANEQLKQYGRRITQVQEEERKRIAYELHDDTAQYLSILKLEIGALLQSGKIKSPQVMDKLRFLEQDADRAFNDVRRYSHELRPGVLEHLGLQAAIEQIAEDINKLKQISVEVCVEGYEPKLSEDIRLAFFRVAQEAINNARKHAKATCSSINLYFQDHHMTMSITDNGIGFNVREAINRAGGKGSLGLMSMHERAKLIGANLKIQSEPGQGTIVILESSI